MLNVRCKPELTLVKAHRPAFARLGAANDQGWMMKSVAFRVVWAGARKDRFHADLGSAKGPHSGRWSKTPPDRMTQRRADVVSPGQRYSRPINQNKKRQSAQFVAASKLAGTRLWQSSRGPKKKEIQYV